MPRAAAKRYKQSTPSAGISLERATDRVPDDGYYYVLLDDDIKGRHRTLKDAQAAYGKLLDETGYAPPQREDKVQVDPGKQAVERYMDELEDYWTTSHKHSRRGGKTMYRS
jgi:hypothetical protein